MENLEADKERETLENITLNSNREPKFQPIEQVNLDKATQFINNNID